MPGDYGTCQLTSICQVTMVHVANYSTHQVTMVHVSGDYGACQVTMVYMFVSIHRQFSVGHFSLSEYMGWHFT